MVVIVFPGVPRSSLTSCKATRAMLSGVAGLLAGCGWCLTCIVPWTFFISEIAKNIFQSNRLRLGFSVEMH